jgi:hypothetical protein
MMQNRLCTQRQFISHKQSDSRVPAVAGGSQASWAAQLYAHHFVAQSEWSGVNVDRARLDCDTREWKKTTAGPSTPFATHPSEQRPLAGDPDAHPSEQRPLAGDPGFAPVAQDDSSLVMQSFCAGSIRREPVRGLLTEFYFTLSIFLKC